MHIPKPIMYPLYLMIKEHIYTLLWLYITANGNLFLFSLFYKDGLNGCRTQGRMIVVVVVVSPVASAVDVHFGDNERPAILDDAPLGNERGGKISLGWRREIDLHLDGEYRSVSWNQRSGGKTAGGIG